MEDLIICNCMIGDACNAKCNQSDQKWRPILKGELNDYKRDFLADLFIDLESKLSELQRESEWVRVEDELPEDRGEPYQVIAAQKKEMGGLYTGTHRRIFAQDWHVRRWPQNFISWRYDSLGQVFTESAPKEG